MVTLTNRTTWPPYLARAFHAAAGAISAIATVTCSGTASPCASGASLIDF